ncbi:hypothetical protein ACFL1Y_01105 [Patescibacteria group bacterium]
MKKEIKKFINDLYKLDPGLKNQEQELITLINQMLASQPNAKLDEKFAQVLRDKLVIKAEQLKPNHIERVRFNNNFNPMKKFTYAISGAVICAVLFISIYIPINKKSQINLNLGELKVSQLDSGTFGSISLQTQDPAQNQERGIGASGGGGGMPATGVQTFSMPAPQNYTYIYSGNDFQLENEQALVYKYQTPADSSKQLANLLKKAKFGLMDINKFSNLGLQNLTLVEDRDFGHRINIDLTHGTISIMENWPKWQQDDSKLNCAGDTKCLQELMMKIEDVPSDEQLIAMADNFLNQYGINKQNYGQPEIRNEWRVFYEQNKETGGGGIPETMQVTYPLMIDGQKVYEQGGYPAGLSVSINIRYNKVAGIYGLRAENYQSATYDLEQNKDEILKLAEAGGLYPNWYGQGENKEMELDTPELGLIKVYNYNTGDYEEMLVPGLIFNIKNKPDNYYGREKIVVLLVKDIIKTNPVR